MSFPTQWIQTHIHTPTHRVAPLGPNFLCWTVTDDTAEGVLLTKTTTDVNPPTARLMIRSCQRDGLTNQMKQISTTVWFWHVGVTRHTSAPTTKHTCFRLLPVLRSPRTEACCPCHWCRMSWWWSHPWLVGQTHKLHDRTPLSSTASWKRQASEACSPASSCTVGRAVSVHRLTGTLCWVSLLDR